MHTQLVHTTSFATQTALSQARAALSEDVTIIGRTAQVGITGDLKLYATESDVARGAITGHFQLETPEMQPPLYIIWSAEGQVLTQQGRSTDIVFDLRGARVGETRTYMLQVQITDMKRCITSGVFIQILVTHDHLL